MPSLRAAFKRISVNSVEKSPPPEIVKPPRTDIRYY